MATLETSIQLVLDVIAELARHLPRSPATDGPLSRPPNFDYIAAAMGG